MKKIITLSILSFLLSISLVLATDDMWANGTYLEDIPTAHEILGYDFGDQHTPHFMLEFYLNKLAETSDRVLLTSYGETYQGRKLFHVVISSPENLARLDEIKKAVRNLTKIDGSVSEADRENIYSSMPAIAMLNYNIHGNEASGAEAALCTAYQLAAGTDETTLGILKNVVTIIDPVQNPDGHDRFVNYVNDYLVVGADGDPYNIEHSQPWPGSRTNAYYFDLNRDWFLMTQVESSQRVAALLNWLPQVSPDFHEMGGNSTYYFAPPMKPKNQLIPQIIAKWWEIYGLSNAAMFDQYGIQYYSKESFDYFYSGYGGSLPSYFGSVAMTYEQASSRGRIYDRSDDTELTLRDGVWHHFLTGMATLNATAEKREERLRDFHQYFVDVDKTIAKSEMKEFYLPPSDTLRVNKIIKRVQTLGGEVKIAEEEFKVSNAYNYFTGKKEDQMLPAGTIIITTRQFAGNAILTVFEPHPPLDEGFLAEERERMRRNLRSRFYDITAWALPLTYGIPAYYASSESSVNTSVVPKLSDIKGETVPVEKSTVAYLIAPDTNANIALVNELFKADYKLRVARLGFTHGDKEYPPGTVVAWVSRNPEKLYEDINSLIKKTGGHAEAAKTGYSKGGIDLGSNNMRVLRKPKIALIGDDPISSYSFGAIRYLFEQSYDVKYSAFRSGGFTQFDIDDYNILILPSSYSWGGVGLESKLGGKKAIERLKNWVRNGGVVIAVGGSVDFLGSEDVGLSSAPKYKQRRKEAGEVEDPYSESPATTADEEKDQKKSEKTEKFEVDKLLRVPGAICKVRLDDRSFLSWGYEDGFVPALVNSNRVYEPISDDQGYAAGRYYAKDELILGGYIWPESLELLPGKAYCWEQYYGDGVVICFAEEPYFRASYDGLDRLFFNAILFSSAFAR